MSARSAIRSRGTPAAEAPGQGDQLLGPLFQLGLDPIPLFLAGAHHEGRSGRGNLGAHPRQAEGGGHAGNAVRGDLRHRTVDADESIPCDRARDGGHRGHGAKARNNLALIPRRAAALALGLRLLMLPRGPRIRSLVGLGPVTAQPPRRSTALKLPSAWITVRNT